MTNKNLAPEIKPINTGITHYNTKQSKYDNAARLPARSIILGPSGSGKTVLLTNLILDVYRNCFSRIYIFSPSINVDFIWAPVKNK
jgi:DNA replication protein DnaC